MLKYIIILCFLIMLSDTYNILLKDSARYKIENSIDEDDYEMINNDQLINIGLYNKENKFYELNKLASKEYDEILNSEGPVREWFKGTEPTVVTFTYDSEIIVTYNLPLTKHPIDKRSITKEEGVFYKYDYLIKEYNIESNEEAKFNTTYVNRTNSLRNGVIHSLEKIVSFDMKIRNCTEEEIKHIGYKAIKCLLNDYKTNRQSPKILAARFWRIAMTWFLVYLAIALTLWCTKGWCCCCLFCKFFKPKQTIEESKKYLVLNPPGVLITGKGRVTQYEPSNYEKERYEEFEHLMRTI